MSQQITLADCRTEAGENESDAVFRVVVTGFGEFHDIQGTNPAWSIASTLPSAIAKAPGSTYRIQILARPQPVQVAYNAAHTVISEIHKAVDPPHLILHIGVATSRSYYSTERIGHSTGYDKEDVNGMMGQDASPPEYWRECPPELSTNARLEDVLARWKGLAADADLRISDDAGHYICDYLFYSSMAYLHCHTTAAEPRTAPKTTAAFLHVPGGQSDEALAKGREIAITLIRAFIESRVDGAIVG